MPSIVDALVSAICGGLGGWLQSRFDYARESKDRRKDAAIESVEDLRALAVNYWRKDGIDRDLEASIKRQMEKLDGLLAGVAKHCRNHEAVFEAGLDSFDSEVTGGGFETKDRLSDAARVQSIRNSAKELVGVIRLC